MLLQRIACFQKKQHYLCDMIIKILVLGLAGMLAYRWLSPPRSLPKERSAPPRGKEEYTEYEEVQDED